MNPSDSSPPVNIEPLKRDPTEWIVGGYDVHVIFTQEYKQLALDLFERFRAFVIDQGMVHDRAMVFADPVGPWPTPMWQVLLRDQSMPQLSVDLGMCIGWLMLNRGSLSVMIHPNTCTQDGGYADHAEHSVWLGESIDLKLEIFNR